MTSVAICFGLICFALLVYIVWREREHTMARADLLNRMAAERTAWRGEREDLLQRIQAPEQAVIEHAARKRPKRRARTIAANDDEAFKERDKRREEGVSDG